MFTFFSILWFVRFFLHFSSSAFYSIRKSILTVRYDSWSTIVPVLTLRAFPPVTRLTVDWRFWVWIRHGKWRLHFLLWKMTISQKFWILFGWYSQSTSQTMQRSLGLPRGASWKDKKVIIATKSPSESKNVEKWKKLQKWKSIRYKNIRLSGSNHIDFWSWKIYFGDQRARRVEKLVLHKT